MVGIGIDLGTTNCCVAVVRNGRIDVLENSLGRRTTPSVIGFIKNEIVIGSTAKKQTARYPNNVIYDIKRLIGLKYHDPQVQKLRKHLPFNIIHHENKLKIAIGAEGKDGIYVPEQLSGYILKVLKQEAEARLDSKIDNVVITVPSYFNDSQRQATVDAGKIAGFKQVNLLNEPTAAAIHYGIDNKIDDGRVILVFDFGGGTFDISIIKYNDNLYEVLTIDGDANLGGEDIDNKLIEFIKEKLNINENNNVKNKRITARLKQVCETAKIDLSSKHDSTVELVDLDTEVTVTRKKFDEISNDIINKTMQIVDTCLKSKNISKIDDILLVGGSTRIQKVKDELKNRFNFVAKQNTNADEAVASGAAIYAAKLYDNQFPELKTVNICQHSLGVETLGDKMSILIPKFTKLPAKKTKRYKTVNEEHDTIDVKIFCGENPSTKNNLFLGEFRVSGIKSGPNGTILHETFEIDDNGILHVSAMDEGGLSKKMTVDLNKGCLTSTEIDYYSEQLRNEFIKSEKVIEFKKLKNDLECKNPDMDTKKWLKDLEYTEKNYLLVLEKLKTL